MEKRDKIQKEILDLKWHALPYYERWAYPKELLKQKKFYLKKRLRAQKWEVQYTRNLALILALFALASIAIPAVSWNITLFLAVSAVVIYWVEMLMKRRLQRIERAKELKKKIKEIESAAGNQ